MTQDMLGYRIAVVGVAAALVVFLIMAGVVLALGNTVPSEYWTAGSAVGGALLGILAPTPPNTLSSAKRHVARANLAVAEAHADAAVKIVADARTAGRADFADVAQQATDEAQLASTHATAAPDWTSYIPTMLLLGLFVISTIVWLAGPVTQLQAFAAASGTALLGMLAPSPSQAGAGGATH